MHLAKAFRTVRKTVRIKAGRRAEITGLPFTPGSQVDVIVVGPAKTETATADRPIYDYTKSLTKKKRIPRYSMKQIETIVHQSRQSRE